MILNMPKALLLGVCSLFVLMGLSQAATIWWFQQQLQQQLNEQSQALSRIILARTAEKIQHQFVFSTGQHIQVLTTPNKAGETRGAVTVVQSIDDVRPSSKTAQQTRNKGAQPASDEGHHQQHRTVEVRQLKNGTTTVQLTEPPANAATPKTPAAEMDLQLELEQTLSELHHPGSDPQRWVKQFRLKTSDSSQQLAAQYLRYQLAVLALSVLLALGIALWLGARLLQPLQLLVSGFKALAQGQTGVQLPTTAPLLEYRQVLQQFNEASRELATLQAQKAELAAQQQLIELGEISRGLVHALRNPLHTMALALEQLRAGTAGNPADLQQLIEQKMQHINRTLTALLTLSCHGIDRSQPVSLPAVLKDLMLEFYQAQIRLELPPQPERCHIAGAEAELRTIFHAVISNAVEASPALGSVSLALTADADGWLLQVRDQGPGISAAIRGQLFAPHVSSKAEGAGMGLYLAKRLLELYYRGKITLENLPQGGVLAEIRLGYPEVSDES